MRTPGHNSPLRRPVLKKKALAAALGAVMSAALLTAGTAAPAGAHTRTTTATPGAEPSPFTLCKLQYRLYYTLRDVLNLCCWYSYSAPVAECWSVWYPYDSSDARNGAARSAPESPTRTA
jgi:hypothetical protein